MRSSILLAHPYWGNIIDSGNANGYTSDIRFSHSFFGTSTFPVYLGAPEITITPRFIQTHPEAHYKPIESILGENCYLLDEFMKSYEDFINNIDVRITTLQERLYEYFKKHISEQLPLIFSEYPVIESLETHNEYIKSLVDIRLLENGKIRLLLYYNLFPAPVFPVTFVNGELQEI